MFAVIFCLFVVVCVSWWSFAVILHLCVFILCLVAVTLSVSVFVLRLFVILHVFTELSDSHQSLLTVSCPAASCGAAEPLNLPASSATERRDGASS